MKARNLLLRGDLCQKCLVLQCKDSPWKMFSSGLWNKSKSTIALQVKPTGDSRCMSALFVIESLSSRLIRSIFDIVKDSMRKRLRNLIRLII
jgi:hypothetical protein